jgi:riboflavin kinase/FMN adenylyltransferase
MGRHLVTLGTFDGVHRGHRRLVASLKADARRLGLEALVVVFDSPPRAVLHPEHRTPLLSSSAERVRWLRGLGVEEVRVVHFDGKLAAMSHGRFFSDFILRRWEASGLIIGPDFAFGRGRLGDAAFLRRACRRKGIFFDVAPCLRAGGEKISSTRIRALLQHARVCEAARLLGRPYRVGGRVVGGDALGASLGFPTANIHLSAARLVPPGVFAVRVRSRLKGLRLWRAAVCNVGTRPTIHFRGRHPLTVEVHIPGFQGNLYGRRLEVEFLRRIRPERRFASLDLLKAQIRRDVRAALGFVNPSRGRKSPRRFSGA